MINVAQTPTDDTCPFAEGDRVRSVTDTDDDESGRVRRIISPTVVEVGWASGVSTPCDVDDLEPEPEPLEYDVYDADPTASGPCDWDASDGPDAEDYEDAGLLAIDVLEWGVRKAVVRYGYKKGDTLYVIVRLPDGSTIRRSCSLQIADWDGSDDDVRNWEAVNSYVSCCYGPDGVRPGDVNVEIGETHYGAWYVRAADEGWDEVVGGPFETRAEAESTAEDYADERNEAEPGEDADAMLARLRTEAAGEPDDDGEYCVYWDTALDDAHVVDRYPTFEAAQAAADLANDGLHRHHPGALLCGYEVRELRDGEWVR